MRHASFADPATNLLDALDAVLSEHDAATRTVSLVPFEPERADVVVKVCDLRWRERPHGRTAIEALAGLSDPAAFAPRDEELLAQLHDERLAQLGARLEAGGPDPLRTRVVATSARWTVNFGDPNTTKALHVGHLRNVAIGHSLASAAEALGTRVVRQSRVGDFGRNMGEAMAGWLRFGGGLSPQQAGVKGDQLIGDCYLAYVQSLGAQEAALGRGDAADAQDGDAMLSRERDVRHDEAEELLAAYRRGEPDAVRLFDDVRRWVTDGHDETYARLGVEVDRTLFESDYLPHAEALAETALQQGVIERVASGATMYETGEQAYPRMLITRRDGFPTQHLRYIATYDATRPLLDGTRTLAVFGNEWHGLARYAEAILRRLHPDADVHPHDNVMHGMVVGDAGVVKSSKGGALLVDELFETLATCDAVAGLERRHSRWDAERLARIVLLGFFLGRPLRQRVPIDMGELLSSRRNVGWTMAQAVASVWDARHDGEPDPDPADPDYRFVLVQSQRHRRLLVKCMEELDLLALVRFHHHLSRWYLRAAPSARTARAMRTVLGAGLDALGLAREEPRCPS
jgi:arginyl-tRNA synthetase